MRPPHMDLCTLTLTCVSSPPFSPFLILSAWQMKEFQELLTLYNPPSFVCTSGGFCMYRTRSVGWVGMGGRGAPWRRWGQGATPASHFYCCCVFVVVVFLHSLFSIKKPFLQPVSDAHSLPLPMNHVPSSLAYQKGPCALWSLVRLGWK